MTSGGGVERPGLLEAGVFLAELAMLAALIYVGIALPGATIWRVVAAIALPVALIVVWGRWLAPRAPRPLPPRTAFGVKVVIFAAVSVLLAIVGPVWLALVFFVVTEVLVVAAERGRARGSTG